MGAQETITSVLRKKFMMFYPEYFVTESTFNGFYHTSFVEGIKGINQGYAMCLH